MKIKVIDEIMGKGKTSAAINYINNSDEDTHFLYITPYLTEVERIMKNCSSKKFKQPETYGTKIQGIKYLFDRKENIVSTHSLFRHFDEEIIDLAYANNYILIMDEVADVVEPYSISYDDMTNIIENYAHVDSETNLLIWDYKEYKGDFDRVKRLCELGCLAIYNDVAMLWLFPVSTFRAFREIYVLTYMFNAQTQRYYYDYYGMEYEYMYVNKINGEYVFSEESNDDIGNKYNYSKLINIIDNIKLNNIGDMEYSLSKSWYERNKNNSLMKQLKNNIGNFFKHYAGTPSNKNLWTTFKDYKELVTGKGYSKGFAASNIRATNKYVECVSVAYLVNKYYNPYVKQFFVKHNVEVDEDGYAVSEMLQFIWRSSIRRGEAITLYIPSKRMRNLLIDWISKHSDIGEKQ